MTTIIVLAILAGLGWIYYQIQDRIGQEQARDWKQFQKEHPEYFRKQK